MIRTLQHQEISEQPSQEFTEQYLLDRLIAAGIGCLEDWSALSPRARRNVFGITSGMARAIDRLVRTRRK
ncbi:MAG TPA: hypothetical protein VHV80_05245 [Steroidobacteraceae bacterium]|nr:hypothetical protein [Steroidobacteraceae bacterium]